MLRQASVVLALCLVDSYIFATLPLSGDVAAAGVFPFPESISTPPLPLAADVEIAGVLPFSLYGFGPSCPVGMLWSFSH